MHLAMTLVGICISKTKTSTTHALSYGLTYRHSVLYGIVVAVSIPFLLKLALKKIIEYEKKVYVNALNMESEQKLYYFMKNLFKKNEILKIAKKYTNNSPLEFNSLISDCLNSNRFNNSKYPATQRAMTETIQWY